MSSPSYTNVKPPIDDFLATVLGLVKINVKDEINVKDKP